MFWLAALAGGFASEAAAGCDTTLGASGGIFGLLGAFLADAIFSFASISYPAWRLLSILIFAVLWLATSLQSSGGAGVSHASHAAGCAYGFVIGPLLLPALPREWMEMAALLLGARRSVVWQAAMLHACAAVIGARYG